MAAGRVSSPASRLTHTRATPLQTDGKVYRVYPSGEVQYLHPKDGVYPEKLNKGRVGVNNNMRSIGKNPDPATVRALTQQAKARLLVLVSLRVLRHL